MSRSRSGFDNKLFQIGVDILANHFFHKLEVFFFFSFLAAWMSFGSWFRLRVETVVEGLEVGVDDDVNDDVYDINDGRRRDRPAAGLEARSVAG